MPGGRYVRHFVTSNHIGWDPQTQRYYQMRVPKNTSTQMLDRKALSRNKKPDLNLSKNRLFNCYYHSKDLTEVGSKEWTTIVAREQTVQHASIIDRDRSRHQGTGDTISGAPSARFG